MNPVQEQHRATPRRTVRAPADRRDRRTRQRPRTVAAMGLRSQGCLCHGLPAHARGPGPQVHRPPPRIHRQAAPIPCRSPGQPERCSTPARPVRSRPRLDSEAPDDHPPHRAGSLHQQPGGDIRGLRGPDRRPAGPRRAGFWFRRRSIVTVASTEFLRPIARDAPLWRAARPSVCPRGRSPARRRGRATNRRVRVPMAKAGIGCVNFPVSGTEPRTSVVMDA